MNDNPHEDDERHINNVLSVVETLVEALVLENPTHPLDFINQTLSLAAQNALSIDRIAQKLSASYHSPLFYIKMNESYGELYEYIKGKKLCMGATVNSLLTLLFKNVYGHDQLVDHYRLSSYSYIDLRTFRATVITSFVYSDFIQKCEQLQMNVPATLSYEQILSILSKILDGMELQKCIELLREMLSSTEPTKRVDEVNITEQEFLAKATSMFISKLRLEL